RMRKWGRLRLADGQNARSAWKEKEKPLERIRMSRVVKIAGDNREHDVAEVQYYFRVRLSPVLPSANLEDLETGVLTLAMVSVFDRPDTEMLHDSYGALWSAAYRGRARLRVIAAKDILGVVAMVPH
ncbi:hypothetical protein OF83DRAFT_1034831, partial [Amylostereum chailletii]